MIYISADIETNGLQPGFNSMISLAAVAFDSNAREVSHFNQNLKTVLPADPEVMRWWSELPQEVFDKARENQKPPAKVMFDWQQWCRMLAEDARGITGVAAPAAFDIPFINWYEQMFLGQTGELSPINTFCMQSYVSGLTNSSTFLRKKNFPANFWAGISSGAHVAIDDARTQAMCFVRLMLDKEYTAMPTA